MGGASSTSARRPKKKARLQRQKVVQEPVEGGGASSSDGIHSFPRDTPDFESSPQTFRGFWKETKPLYEHGYSALGHELVGPSSRVSTADVMPTSR